MVALLAGGVAVAAADAPSGWCLELIPGQSRIQFGEPMVVGIALRNCSGEPRSIVDLLAPEYGFLSVRLRTPEGSAAPWRPPSRREARGKSPRRLLPGEQLVAWIPLYVDAGGWTLGWPGRYEVSASYSAGDAKASASSASVEVLRPKSSAESVAAGLLMDRDSAHMVWTGQDPKGTGASRLAQLRREHPESPLAPYAAMGLGLGHLQESFDPQTKAFRKADCPGAVELLGPAVARVGDPYLAASAASSLARCLGSLGQSDEALAAIEDYGRTHPRARSLPGVGDRLDRGTARPAAD